MKQSIAGWCFEGKIAPEALLKAAAEIGYTGIELIAPEHWGMVRDHGLTISAHGAHRPLEIGLNNREAFPEIERQIHENLELAVRWNIPNLICFSGNRNGLDDKRGAEITAEHLTKLAPLAESAGVTLVLELLNSRVDHPDYQCDHTVWGVEVCKMVDSPRVKLLYDIYHAQIMDGDIIRTIQNDHPYFAHYHTAGNPGRNDLDHQQELNYPAIADAIKATGYTGFVTHEFIPKGEPITALRQAFEIFRS
jgi:hydroxypyruvate isomerase